MRQWNKFSLTCRSLKCLLLVKNCFAKTALKKFLVLQTNSARKHSQLGSQITEPISAWKVYLRSPPGEIYARNLQSTLKAWLSAALWERSQRFSPELTLLEEERRPDSRRWRKSRLSTLVFRIKLKAEKISLLLLFFFSWSFWSKMGKAKKGTTARRETKAAWRGKQVSKRKRGSFKWNDKLISENDYGDFRNRVCFTFSLDNNSNILMLIEIIFDWPESLSSPIPLPYL